METAETVLYLVIQADGSQKGPATFEVLKHWASQGVISPQTILQNSATGETRIASTLPGLFTPQAPPTLSAPPIQGQPAAYPRQSPGVQAAGFDPIDMLVPVRADIFAVAAGYFGLFSLIVIGAPFAVIFGIIALRRIKLHPERTGKGRAWFGIGIGSVVICLTLLAIVSELFTRS